MTRRDATNKREPRTGEGVWMAGVFRVEEPARFEVTVWEIAMSSSWRRHIGVTGEAVFPAIGR